MTFRKSSFRAICRRRLMASAASWVNVPSPVASLLSGTPILIGSFQDYFLSPYLMVNLSSAISAEREYFNEPLPVSLTGRASPTSLSGYSTRRNRDLSSVIDLPSLDELSETSTILASDFSSIELRVLSQMQSCSSRDALSVDTRVSSLELFMGPTNRASRPFENSGCSRSSRSRTPRGG